MSHSSNAKPWTQTITANSVGKETILVLLSALLIIYLSAVVIFFNQIDIENEYQLAENETSLRYDLKPNEQGIYSDLLIVFQDWYDMGGNAPEIETLIEEDWPPFTDILMGKQRGGHVWQKHTDHGKTYYLGISEHTDIAGHFLWILPSSRDGEAAINVWLNQSKQPPHLSHLHEADLPSMGWKKISAATEIKRAQ